MELKELVEQLNTANTELKNLKDAQAKEVKELGEAQTETKSALEEAESKMTEIKSEFESMDKKLIELETEAKRFRGGQPGGQKKSLGQLFVEHDRFAELKANGRGDNQPVTFDRKDITGTTGSAIALVDEYRDPEVYRSIGGRRQLRIRDLLPSIPVDSGSVEIMRQNSFTNNAAPQQPGTPDTAAGAGELETKAQSNITWELVTVPVRTIAHWVPASRQVLSDAPMLQGLIDTELQYGLQLEADQQLLFGDGTNQNLTGIMNDAAINDVGEIAAGTAADDRAAAMIDKIRSAITECQKNEYNNVNGVVLNPEDWETIQTAKASDGHYIYFSFAATGDAPEQLWRVPVVVTNAMTVGNFLLGDWTMGAKVYVREGVTVRVSESHADYFVRNGVAVLSEERYCLGVNRPKAFTKGQFTIATT